MPVSKEENRFENIICDNASYFLDGYYAMDRMGNNIWNMNKSTITKKEEPITKDEVQELREALIKNNEPSPDLDHVLNLLKKYDKGGKE